MIRIGERSPFENFVSLEGSRNAIYSDFIDIDEIREIAPRWIALSAEFAEELGSLVGLADSVYKRYLDEYSKQPATNVERIAELSEILMGLTKFKFELAILMRTYSNMANEGVMGYKPKEGFNISFIFALDSLTSISAGFYDPNLPSPADISEAVGLLFRLEERRREKTLLEVVEEATSDSPEVASMILRRRGDFHKLQGVFKSVHVDQIIKRASDHWWWHDPLLSYFNQTRAQFHWEQLNKLWGQHPGSMEREAIFSERVRIPLAESKAELEFQYHYYKLAMEAASQGDHEHAAAYFSNVYKRARETRLALKSLLQTIPDNEEITAELVKSRHLEEKMNAMTIIANTSASIANLCENAKDISHEQLFASCEAFLQEMEELVVPSSAPHLAQLHLAFSAALRETRALLKGKAETEELMEALTFSLRTGTSLVISTLDAITEQIREELGKDPKGARSILVQISESTWQLAEIMALMPKNTPKRKETRSRLLAVNHYARSMVYTFEAAEVEEHNIVMALLLKGKAHYNANVAMRHAEKIDKSKIPFENIFMQRGATRMSGFMTEAQLFYLVTQYAFLNDVVDTLLNTHRQYATATGEKGDSSAPSDKKKRLASAVEDLKSLEDFRALVMRIGEDSGKMMELQGEYSNLLSAENWMLIGSRVAKAKVAAKFTEAVRSAILADISNALSIRSQTIKHYESAQKAAYSAGEFFSELHPGILGENKNVPEDVYMFAQFCKERSNDLRGASKKQTAALPLEKSLSLYKQIVFMI